MLSDIKELVVQNQTKKALKQLHQTTDGSWEDPILLLSSSQTQLDKERTQQLISGEEAQRRQNQINASLLELLNIIEQNDLSPQLAKEKIAQGLPYTQQLTQNEQQIITDFSDASFEIGEDSDVVIGSGNTIFKALGKWQFWTILVLLFVIVMAGLFGIRHLSSQQEDNNVSLTAIQSELAKMAENRDGSFTQQVPELKEKIASGVKAFKKQNYDEAIKELEEVAQKAKLATVYQALEEAYLKKGSVEKAFEMREEANRIDPEVYRERPLADLKGKTLNLLAPENGGSMKATSNQAMKKLTDQSLRKLYIGNEDWVVYGFKDNLSATLESVDYYVARTDKYNIDSFELLVSNDSPTGNFTSIGTFTPQNAYMNDQPFQTFDFEPVKAKYVKFRYNTPSRIGVYLYELRIWGKL